MTFLCFIKLDYVTEYMFINLSEGMGYILMLNENEVSKFHLI